MFTARRCLAGDQPNAGLFAIPRGARHLGPAPGRARASAITALDAYLPLPQNAALAPELLGALRG